MTRFAWLLLSLTLGCGSHQAALRSARDSVVPRTLVLYDDSGAYAWLGELYAIGAGVLSSHFGAWSAMPVSTYRPGAMRKYEAAIYIGSTFGQPLPTSFIDDVLSEGTDVIWLGTNLWQLAERTPDFATRYGFSPGVVDDAPVHHVMYKGVRLSRRTDPAGGITTIVASDASKASVLATALHDDGTTLPWAVRSRHLLYIGENPLAYVTSGDRYLALCDLLFDVYAPTKAERHRAIVRIEDVNPRSSPEALRAVADALAARGVPFAIALIPVFRAKGQMTRLRDAPDVVAALKYMQSRGGSLVLHGYTHQYGDEPNPWDGTTARDFEFFRAHLEGDSRVVLDGPVRGDSETWADRRIAGALAELDAAGLPGPQAFEYPHYAGSPSDSRAIARRIPVAFQRELFFSGGLGGGNEDTTHSLGLTFPFVVDDLFGFRVIPENLDHYVPDMVSADDLVERGQTLRVVRDGVAGFFFHPIYDVSVLAHAVEGLKAAGYTFVGIDALVTREETRMSSVSQGRVSSTYSK